MYVRVCMFVCVCLSYARERVRFSLSVSVCVPVCHTQVCNTVAHMQSTLKCMYVCKRVSGLCARAVRALAVLHFWCVCVVCECDLDVGM